MKRIIVCSVLLLIVLILGCAKKVVRHYTLNDLSPGKIQYAGVRSSSYGIRPFPKQTEWQSAIDQMCDYYPGAQPCAVWIVGVLKRPDKCYLQFPSNDKEYNKVVFDSTDRHEKYLNYFDSTGVKIFLQVEPASADVVELMDLVLSRYKHHQCVIGFGVDVEWYREIERKGWGMPVKDDQAKQWEEHLREYNDEYRLFLKHWDRKWMPPNYRGDILFISDSQMLKNFSDMHREFTGYWADYFKPNMVGYQIGYDSDRKWWDALTVPPQDIGIAIAREIEQQCCVFWVDFTLRDVFSEVTN
ncbi:MAG: hypothetical protein R6V04_00770 [bacterium]